MANEYVYELPDEPFDPDKLSVRGSPATGLKGIFGESTPQPAGRGIYERSYKGHLQRSVAGGYPGGAEGYLANARAARNRIPNRKSDIVGAQQLPEAANPGILPRLDDWTLNRENFIFQGAGGDLGRSSRGGKIMGEAWPDAYIPERGSAAGRRSVIAMPSGPSQGSFPEEMVHGAQPYALPQPRVGDHYGSVPAEAGAKFTNLKQDYVREAWPDERTRLYGFPDPATGKPHPANIRQYGPEDSKRILDDALANPQSIQDDGLKSFLSSPEGQKDVRENYDYWLQFLNETAQRTPRPPGLFTGRRPQRA